MFSSHLQTIQFEVRFLIRFYSVLQISSFLFCKIQFQDRLVFHSYNLPLSTFPHFHTTQSLPPFRSIKLHLIKHPSRLNHPTQYHIIQIIRQYTLLFYLEFAYLAYPHHSHKPSSLPSLRASHSSISRKHSTSYTLR